jgi:hypothetical protein
MGASAVEFALTLPLVFILFSGVLDLAYFLSQEHVVTQAARDAVRYSVRASADPAVVATLAESNAASWLDAMNIPCDQECVVDAEPLVVRGYNAVRIDISVPIPPIMGFVLPTQVASAHCIMLLDTQGGGT